MVIAVIAVRLMDMAVHQIINVVTVRHRFVSTSWSVRVIGVMIATLMLWRALGGVLFGHFQIVTLDALFTDMMKMPIVQIIDMIAMLDCGVATFWSMLMIVIGMNLFAHRI